MAGMIAECVRCHCLVYSGLFTLSTASFSIAPDSIPTQTVRFEYANGPTPSVGVEKNAIAQRTLPGMRCIWGR